MSYTAALQAADASPGATFMTALNTILVAAGFTAVETWTSSTNTAIIYKSPAGSNSFGSDWYLNVLRTSDAATSVSFGIAEAWNTGTKKFTNYGPTSGTFTPTSVFAVNDATGVLPTGAMAQRSVTLSTAGFQYWVSANVNRVVVGARVGIADTAVYAGLYDDVLPIALSPFPLAMINLASASTGTTTREPGATISTNNAFGVATQTNFAWSVVYGSGLDVYQGKYIPARTCLWSSRVSAGSANGMRGLLKDMVQCPITAAVNGDTMTVVDSVGVTKTYTRIGNDTFQSWADQGV
jgi:hypothetical protein